jgi:hypothetical protein
MQLTINNIIFGILFIIIVFFIIKNASYTNNESYINNYNNKNSNSKLKLKSNLKSKCKSKSSQLNFITYLNRKDNLDNPTDYYTKKKNVRFEDDPIERICENPVFNADDEFLNKYVFNKQFYCESELNPPYKNDPKKLAAFRDDFYNFRDKTQQLSLEYSPVDSINDMILGNTKYDDAPINKIYDKLTANQYKSI